LGEIEVTSGPSLSAGERERGKGEWPAGWLGRGPGRGIGRGGVVLGQKAEREKGGREKLFRFYFSKQIFQTLFKM